MDQFLGNIGFGTELNLNRSLEEGRDGKGKEGRIRYGVKQERSPGARGMTAAGRLGQENL